MTGEGGSSGAIAIFCANRVLMLEHSIYSVISPEGHQPASCGATAHARPRTLTNAMKITAPDLIELKIVDRVIPEPLGSAHADRERPCRTSVRRWKKSEGYTTAETAEATTRRPLLRHRSPWLIWG